jgi:hypothetical protein
MSLPPAIYTSPSRMDGTVTGLIVTAVVAALALVMLIGLVYWADSHPAAGPPTARWPGTTDRPVPAAEPRSVVPGPGTPGSPPPRASAAPARDPEPAVSRLVGPHPDNNTADVRRAPLRARLAVQEAKIC